MARDYFDPKEFLVARNLPLTQRNMSLAKWGQNVAGLLFGFAMAGMTLLGYWDPHYKLSPMMLVFGAVIPFFLPTLLVITLKPWLLAFSLAAKDGLITASIIYFPFYIIMSVAASAASPR